MDKEKNESGKNKGGKETFIFGSWKCRNLRKTRLPSTDLVRDKWPCSKGDEEKKKLNSSRSNKDNPPPSSSAVYYKNNSYSHSGTTEEKHGIKATRRAISVYDQYDQLHEQDFWCPRCNGKMEEPRLLACLHSVCTNCVNEFMSKDYRGLSLIGSRDAGDSFPFITVNKQIEGCPICDFPLPKYGSFVPPPHYSLQHRLVIYAVRRRLSQRAICCDSCPEEVQATQHCSTCLCNLCQDCATEHEGKRASSPRGHRVRALWEAKRIRHVAVCLLHPAHPVRYHCLACQQVACKECMWRGEHRAHASEDAASAGARAALHLGAALARARALLNVLLTEYNESLFEPLDEPFGHHFNPDLRPCTAFQPDRDSLSETYHFRSRSAISSYSREAKERIQEFSRLKRARYLIDAIFIGEDLLANGSDVEILSLKKIILKRLKFLGVTFFAIEAQARHNNSTNKNDSRAAHSGIYHCCTFCSSGGKKDANCACNGTMPGEYKGCGHGHPGHPGVHHWSCCGSIYRDGTCLLPRKCTLKITL